MLSIKDHPNQGAMFRFPVWQQFCPIFWKETKTQAKRHFFEGLLDPFENEETYKAQVRYWKTHSEKFRACEKIESPKAIPVFCVLPSLSSIQMQGGLLVILLIRELNKKMLRKYNRILPRTEEGHPD